MEAFWTPLFVMGLTLPALLVIGTAVLVWHLARRARAVGMVHPPWRYVVLHLAIVIGAQLALLLVTAATGPVALAASKLGAVAAFATLAIVPYRLFARVQSLAPPTEAPAARRARPWGFGALIGLTGALLPWVVGVGVKTWLDAHGQPTLPYSDFLIPSALPVLLLLTLVSWGFPFLLLAAVPLIPVRLGIGPDGRPSRLPVWLAYAVGVAAAIPVFIGVFWKFEGLYLITPLGVLLLVPMGLGYVAGLAVVRIRRVREGAVRVD